MGRVAIVTGGTRGIGEAICVALKAAGMTAVANYAGNDEKARAFTEKHGIPAYRWDVADYEACQKGVAKVEADVGPVDVLVNNAGITRDGTIMKMTYQMWKEVIDTNLGGCFNMAKAVFAGMRDRGWGRVVNIGSVNGQAGQYGQVNYAAAKSGIHGFTKALAQEGAKFGVTVNALAPGYIDTDMVAAVPQDVLAKIIARVPVGRLGHAEEIARGSLSCVPKMLALSPGRRCRSTVGNICTEDCRNVAGTELVKRSVNISGHATSISLEPVFWDALKRAADEAGLSLNALVARIDEERTTNLSSAIRVWLFEQALRSS